jgi:hypothetical protein
MEKIIASPVKISLHKQNFNPVYGEGVLQVSLEDEGGGTYLKIEQLNDVLNYITIDFNELEALLEAAKMLGGITKKSSWSIIVSETKKLKYMKEQ